MTEQYQNADSQKKEATHVNKILQLQDICFSYHSLSGETDVLKNITFDVNEGEFIAIIGSSGSGKSTF